MWAGSVQLFTYEESGEVGKRTGSCKNIGYKQDMKGLFTMAIFWRSCKMLQYIDGKKQQLGGLCTMATLRESCKMKPCWIQTDSYRLEKAIK